MAAALKAKRDGESIWAANLREFRSAFTGLRREESIAGYLFLLPNLLGFIVFMLFPILFAFYIMLTDWSLAKEPQFIGLKNFDTMINDRLFWKSLGNSFYYTFVAVPTGIFIAFWLALALNRKMRGIIFFRTVYFLPQITLTVAAATIWRWIYQPEIGMINHVLDLIGIEGPKWIHNTKWAMPSVIIMSNWQGIGFRHADSARRFAGYPGRVLRSGFHRRRQWLAAHALRHPAYALASDIFRGCHVVDWGVPSL